MKKLLSVLIVPIFLMGGISLAASYTQEQQDAYEYAYSQHITTIDTIEKANLNGPLTRVAMAKMISYFAINVLGLQPQTSLNCSFSDVSASLDKQYNYGVTQACQLGLMGMGSDGKKSDKFDPYGTVTRGQFATAFSRALSQVNGSVVADGNPYYSTHLSYLHSKGIINSVSTPLPSAVEKRGNVMIMMNRAGNTKTNTNNSVSGLGKYGKFNTYAYRSNNQVQSAEYQDNDGNRNGDYVSFYENGQIKEKGQYKDNEKTGEWIEYFQDGSLASKGSYKNGKLDGYRIRYCEKGNTKCTSLDGNYKDGKQVFGLEQYGKFNTYAYRSNGQVQSAEYQDDNGKKNGDYVSFYENGQVKERGQYKNNQKSGEWIEYNENGEIKSKGNYENGELITDGDEEGEMNVASYITLEKGKASMNTDLKLIINNKSSGKIRISEIRLGNFTRDECASVYFDDNTMDSILRYEDHKGNNIGIVQFPYPVYIESNGSKYLTVRADKVGTEVTVDEIVFEIEENDFKISYVAGKQDTSVARWEDLYAEKYTTSYLTLEKGKASKDDTVNLVVNNKSLGKIRIFGIEFGGLGDLREVEPFRISFGNNEFYYVGENEESDTASITFDPVDIEREGSESLVIEANVTVSAIVFAIEEENFMTRHHVEIKDSCGKLGKDFCLEIMD